MYEKYFIDQTYSIIFQGVCWSVYAPVFGQCMKYA